MMAKLSCALCGQLHKLDDFLSGVAVSIGPEAIQRRKRRGWVRAAAPILGSVVRYGESVLSAWVRVEIDAFRVIPGGRGLVVENFFPCELRFAGPYAEHREALRAADERLFRAALEMSDWNAVPSVPSVPSEPRPAQTAFRKLRRAAAGVSLAVLRQAVEMDPDRDFGPAITILETFEAGCGG